MKQFKINVWQKLIYLLKKHEHFFQSSHLSYTDEFQNKIH